MDGPIAPDLSEMIKREMFTIEHVYLHNPQPTPDDFLSEYFTDPSMRAAFIEAVEPEADIYEANGFDQYLTLKASAGIISTTLKNHLLALKAEYSNFIEAPTLPTLQQTVTFWTNKVQAIPSLALCGAEAQLVEMMYHSALGVAKYLYTYAPNSLTGDGLVTDRDCKDDKFGTIVFCLGLTAIATVVTYAVIAVLLAEAIVEATINGQNANNTTGAAAITALIAAFGGIKGFMSWCCGWFTDIGVDCRKVQNIHAVNAGNPSTGNCGVYSIKPYGFGTDVASLNWTNTNLIPATATTNSATLFALYGATVPNPSVSSDFTIVTTCDDSSIGGSFNGSLLLNSVGAHQ